MYDYVSLCILLCLSFGHATVFLIPAWFILFIQLKELCCIVFFVLGSYLLGVLLSFLFLHGLFHLSNQMNCVFIAVLCILFCFGQAAVFFIHPDFLSSIDSNRWTNVVVAVHLCHPLSFLFIPCSSLNIKMICLFPQNFGEICQNW